MSFGVVEVLVILLAVGVFFGAGKLPSVMGDLAKGVRNFKQGIKGDETAPADEEVRAAAPVPPTTVTATTTTPTTPPPPPALLEAPGRVETAGPEPRRG